MIFLCVVAVLGMIALAGIWWIGIILYAIVSTLFGKEETHPQAKITVTHNQPAATNQEDTQTLPLKPSRIIIHYQDGKNEETERTIRPEHIEYRMRRNGMPDILYLTAYCELRKRPRTFRVDRIEAAYDADTGEVIRNVPAALWRQTGKMLNI
ncbi:helix-turn-helix transcriptional regulator [Acetobacter oryzifermentans]|uniref:WYL domain-containing protein n=1 Tax=Acetobacter oryzifermentans TaxID=1633874 RepID=A0ABM6AKS6_9PROT|nr:WYL domain-containing protein [Acetobacter oryzifermentans]ANA14189.1 hypothetical protein WG31_09390 [Acetobacter oryzifermentans]